LSGERTIGVRFNMIAGDIVFWAPLCGGEDTGLCIVLTIRQVLQDQEWGCGSPLTQIDLNGIGIPLALF